MLIHAYLDTAAPDGSRSELKVAFETFALRKGHRIKAFYNDQQLPQSRSSLFRLLRDKGVAIASQSELASPPPQHEPYKELFRLLGKARPGDVLLIETAALLGKLSEEEWQRFRQRVSQRKIRVVTLDVEASWVMVTSESAMAPIAEQLTAMLLDTLEAAPRADVGVRQDRHLEGIARAKARGKYKGRPINHKKHEQILTLLNEGYSWSEVCAETGASRSTVARVVKSRS